MTPEMAKRATPHTKCFTQTACRMSENYKTADARVFPEDRSVRAKSSILTNGCGPAAQAP